MFEQGDRVCLAFTRVPEVAKLRRRLGLPLFYLGVFHCYRTEEERAEWRQEDDCWVCLDTQGRKCYPSFLLVKITPEQEKELRSKGLF